MTSSPQLARQLLTLLKQHTQAADERHLKTLSGMVAALILSGQVNLSAWIPYLCSRARQARSYQRRCERWLSNKRIDAASIYKPLILELLKDRQEIELLLSFDTSLLWNRFCLIEVALVYGGRALPIAWKVLEHGSASVSFSDYAPLLERLKAMLPDNCCICLLADRGFAHQTLIEQLQQWKWHYCIRAKADQVVHRGTRVTTVSQLIPSLVGEAHLYEGLRLFEAGDLYSNLVTARPAGVDDPWVVLTDLPPTLQILSHYASRFSIEHLFHDNKSGEFDLEACRIRDATQLERLYLVIAIATVYATLQGLDVHQQQQRRRIDIHLNRGLSFLKLGLRWIRGAVYQGWQLLAHWRLPAHSPPPASSSRHQAENRFYTIEFNRVLRFASP